MPTDEILRELHEPFILTADQIAFYRKNGYIKLSQVLSPALLAHYRSEILARVEELSAERLPMEQRTTYGKAFLQVMNLWLHSEVVKEFVFGRRLARIAAELMEVTGVRLYHDQALFKEPHGGLTPWHADQYYWPLSSDRSVTVWIPLISVPLDRGPLAFAAGSQHFPIGRELEISDESELTMKEKLARAPLDEGPFDLGDVSFHSGWTFHRAGANQSDTMREVFTIIYIDEDMRLVEPRNKHQINDMNTWCPGVEVGAVIDSPINPVLYSARKQE